MKIKKIYKKKRTDFLKCNKYLIVNKLNIFNNKNKHTHKINEPLFKGGSFTKILIPEKNTNLIKIITHNELNVVCLFYDNKWYFGNYVKQKNMIQQHRTILSLISKLKNKIA